MPDSTSKTSSEPEEAGDMVDETGAQPGATAEAEAQDGPWWQEGLPFSCSLCGKCCKARGDVAHVYVGEEDQERLAVFLDLPRQDFLSRYTKEEEGGYRGLRFLDGQCIFLDGKSCRVHEAKPTQCRTWPFWPELLESPQTYQEQVKEFCPGSRVGSPVVDAVSIARQMAETDAALDSQDEVGGAGDTV